MIAALQSRPSWDAQQGVGEAVTFWSAGPVQPLAQNGRPHKHPAYLFRQAQFAAAIQRRVEEFGRQPSFFEHVRAKNWFKFEAPPNC